MNCQKVDGMATNLKLSPEVNLKLK